MNIKTICAVGFFCISLFLGSCSNEDFENVKIIDSAYTELEKAEIVALAEKYGVTISFDETKSCNKMSLLELEERLKKITSLKKDTIVYRLAGKKSGDSFVFTSALPNSQKRVKTKAIEEWGFVEGNMSSDFIYTVSVEISGGFGGVGVSVESFVYNIIGYEYDGSGDMKSDGSFEWIGVVSVTFQDSWRWDNVIYTKYADIIVSVDPASGSGYLIVREHSWW